MDGLGQLPGAPGAAAELTHDAPGLELSVGAFTRGAEPGMSPVGVLWEAGLFRPLYGVRMCSPAPV